MAPAEVSVFRSGIGPDQKKMHSGNAQKFEAGGIKADVGCYGLDLTEVRFSGQDLRFEIKGNILISTEGSVEKGRITTYLKEAKDSIKITDGAGNRITVNHTRHDGSTGEVG